MISVFFFIFFGMVAVNFFKGGLVYCELTGAEDMKGFDYDKLIDKWDCFNIGGDFRNREVSFNSLDKAMEALFPIS